MVFRLCWQVFCGETYEMWKKFGEYGVAICSTYSRLRTCLDKMPDQTHLGLMRYGEDRLFEIGKYNTLQFINTKRKEYGSEQGLQAIIECPDLFDGQNRHFDLKNVPHRHPLDENKRHSWMQEFKRRRIDVEALLNGAFVSPFAGGDALQKAKQWAEVRSANTRFAAPILKRSPLPARGKICRIRSRARSPTSPRNIFYRSS